jgi:FO synthase
MQGGIHPHYTGQHYIDLCRAVKQAVPEMHIHAFSPLEVLQGAQTLGVGVKEFLALLKQAGLGTLPGTAAEILDDEVRAELCADKLSTRQWLEVMDAAHELGLRTTATIMFGHIDHYEHWARHLLRIRRQQQRSGGFTEFVPLPFVHLESPIAIRGQSRAGPTFREAVLMHAVARLVLHGQIHNIQASWVKMGPKGLEACLQSGANDLGGSLMNESITRAAGASTGQEMAPSQFEAVAKRVARQARQRNTLYGEVSAERKAAGRAAGDLLPVVNSLANRCKPERPRPLAAS